MDELKVSDESMDEARNAVADIFGDSVYVSSVDYNAMLSAYESFSLAVNRPELINDIVTTITEIATASLLSQINEGN